MGAVGDVDEDAGAALVDMLGRPTGGTGWGLRAESARAEEGLQHVEVCELELREDHGGG